jgi:NADH dehydrogenase
MDENPDRSIMGSTPGADSSMVSEGTQRANGMEATDAAKDLGSQRRTSIVAVTGGTGFIGRHLADRFRSRGWEVRALVRDLSRNPFREPGIRLFRCDLPDTIDPEGLQGADVLIHCAYMTRFTDLESARRVNEDGTRRLIDAALERRIGKLVFISSQSAHEGARSYYGRSKLALEKLFARETDLVLRLGLVIGRSGEGLFHRMADMVRRSRVVPLFGGGRQPLQTVHVEDLSMAVEAALGRGLAGLLTIAHPNAVAMGEFLRMIAERAARKPGGRRPVFLPVPMAPALLALRAIEGLRVPFPVSSENLLGLQCLRATDTTGDLERIGVTLRDTAAALDDALG